MLSIKGLLHSIYSINQNILYTEVLMFPDSCKNDIIELILSQKSSRILYISDGKPNSEDLFHFLQYSIGDTISYYNGEDINEIWDMIIISDLYIIKDIALNNTLRELLNYVKHSLLIVSATYLNSANEISGVLGRRYVHPVRFSEFDFVFKTYEEGDLWSAYNFYAPSHTSIDHSISLATTTHISRNDKKKLNVLYVLPHLFLTGGLKCLLTHAQQLFKRGHNVYLMNTSSNDAIPTWCDFMEGRDITGQLHFSNADELLNEIYNEKKIDVIVLGFYSQISLFSGLDLPIIYWEQGYEFLFGDFKKLLAYNAQERNELKQIYRSNITFATNSVFLGTILKARFGCTSHLLYTGIDTKMFYPPATKPANLIPKILLVGNPHLPFKGFRLLLTALNYIWQKGYRFTVTWAAQTEAKVEVDFPLSYIVNVPQKDLSELYRTHDIYINTSLYEAFSMPPLEAMACGTAVIATDCGGINTYAEPGENIILVEQGNADDLVTSITYLLNNPQARTYLAENGIKTANKFCIDNAVEQLENIIFTAIERP